MSRGSISVMDASKFRKLIDQHKAGSTTLAQVDAEIAAYEEDPDQYLVQNPTPDRDGVVRHRDGTPIYTGDFVFPGINMSDIARDTGLTVGGVSRMFNGDRKARLHTLMSVAHLYTGGDVAAVRLVIQKRVMRRLKEDKEFRHAMSPEQRERLIHNAGLEVVYG